MLELRRHVDSRCVNWRLLGVVQNHDEYSTITSLNLACNMYPRILIPTNVDSYDLEGQLRILDVAL